MKMFFDMLKVFVALFGIACLGAAVFMLFQIVQSPALVAQFAFLGVVAFIVACISFALSSLMGHAAA